VHVRISSPPVKWPCFYGIDFATRSELIANGVSVAGIQASIGADSLGYISLAGLVEATETAKDDLCRACFDGEYPVSLPAEEHRDKHLLEGTATLQRAESLTATVGGLGALDFP
jgi:amidophosphoribosyltransferase